jgi:hypothetical protein
MLRVPDEPAVRLQQEAAVSNEKPTTLRRQCRAVAVIRPVSGSSYRVRCCGKSKHRGDHWMRQYANDGTLVLIYWPR